MIRGAAWRENDEGGGKGPGGAVLKTCTADGSIRFWGVTVRTWISTRAYKPVSRRPDSNVKNSAADRVYSRSMDAKDRDTRVEGKRRTHKQEEGGGCFRTRSRAVSSATLVCRGDSIVFSLFFPLSLGSLDFFYSSPSLSGHRVDSMIPSSWTRGRSDDRRVACSLIFALTSFRDVSIDFISRAAASRWYG